MQGIFFLCGIAVMVAFIRNAHARRAVHHARLTARTFTLS